MIQVTAVDKDKTVKGEIEYGLVEGKISKMFFNTMLTASNLHDLHRARSVCTSQANCGTDAYYIIACSHAWLVTIL